MAPKAPWRPIGTDAVEAAIRKRGTYGFTGPELALELGCTRQTIYKHINILRERGHRIEGSPWHGFMARMLREAA